jgi:NAD(P)-dependent dehydrogenase (short-subunit alcohol dehydrogenase family)
VSDPQQVQEGIARVLADFGKIDVFIANAGELRFGYLKDNWRFID